MAILCIYIANHPIEIDTAKIPEDQFMEMVYRGFKDMLGLGFSKLPEPKTRENRLALARTNRAKILSGEIQCRYVEMAKKAETGH